MKHSVALLLMSCGMHALPSVGQTDGPSEKKQGVLTIYWENDGTVLKPNNATDRHYTNGVGVSLAWQSDFAAGFFDWLDPNHRATDATASGVTFGQLMFTPQNIQRVVPDPSDRPYAGYLYVGGFVQRSTLPTGTNTWAVFDHLQLDVGVVGPSALAEDVQVEVHDIVSDPEPLGWDSQLDDEGTFQLTWTRKWRRELGDFEAANQVWQVQMIPHARLRAGTVYVDAQAGALVRVGLNLPADFGPGFLQDIGDATQNPARGWVFYVYAGAAARLVAHDIFLAGGTFNDGPSVDIEPVVGEVAYGFVLSRRSNSGAGRLEFAWGQRYSTDFFEGQDGSDGLGQIALTWSWEW